MARRKLLYGDYLGDDDIPKRANVNSPLGTSMGTPDVFDSILAPTKVSSPTFNSPVRKKINWGKIGDAAGEFSPYLSNVANSLRQVPNIAPPTLMSNVNPVKVNYDNQRVESDRQMIGMNRGADRGLDENTAAAVKAANLTSNIRSRNSITEQESNTNAQLQGQANQLNSAINSQNTGYLNQNKRDNLEASVAQQREQSQNLANASDKFIAQQAERDRQKLDANKFAVMSQIWKDSGVTDRILAGLKKQGIMSPQVQAFGGRMKAFAEGGPIGGPAGSTYKGTFNNPDSDTNTSLDGLNYSIVKGGNPLSHVQGRQMLQSISNQYGQKEGQNLVTNLSIFNSRPDLIGKSPEQKLEMFYNMYPSKSVSRLKNIGYGPVSMYHNTPNVDTSTASLAMGGSIHINPANRGKFNATKAKTGKTTEQLTHSSNPVTRKRAVFAQNASHWNHKALGGRLKVF